MSNLVTIDRMKVDEALHWAKENGPGYITNKYHMRDYNSYDVSKFDFFFVPNAKEEMTMVALKFT